jgi:hypothetical protein
MQQLLQVTGMDLNGPFTTKSSIVKGGGSDAVKVKHVTTYKLNGGAEEDEDEGEEDASDLEDGKDGDEEDEFEKM